MTNPSNRPVKVGLEIKINDRARSSGALPPWEEIRQVARRAEEVGFDSLWIEDHLLFEQPDGNRDGVWECWSLLAALAAVTERVELGPLVLCTGFRNPALLAKMADTVDEISGGRLILGLGAGWNEAEYRAFGFPFDHRFRRFEESLRIIRGLLREGVVDYEGEFYQARDCVLRPHSSRPAGPPILIGTTGPRMLRLTARYADIWNVYFPRIGNQSEGLASVQAEIDAACREVGRDPATLERSVSVLVDVSPPGAPSPAPWRVPPLSGTPEQIADGLRAFGRAGASQLQLWLEPCTVEGIERFAPVLELLDRG